jgi:Spy/CpxP family protein refolding chaperone
MRTKKYVIGIATLAICISGLIIFKAQAQSSPPTMGFVSGRLAERAREKLGLTDEQLAQIKDVLKAEKTNIISLLTRVRDTRAGLRDAIRSAGANETSVRAASAKVAAVEADAAVERMKIFHQVNPILTDEQRTKLAAMESKLEDFIDQAISRADTTLGE